MNRHPLLKMRMKESSEIKMMEQELRCRMISVDKLLRDAGVHRSTWQRIKSEATIPNGTTMRKLRAAFDQIKGSRQ